MLASTVSNPPLFLGIVGVVILVAGFVGVGLLAAYVIRRAPKDGSDIGRDPPLNADEQRRRNGSGSGERQP